MAKLIEAKTRLDAWEQAVRFLLERSPVLNLVLAIQSPERGTSDSTIDQFLADESQLPMHTVAETIFPSYEYMKRGLDGVLEFYPHEVYPSIKNHPSNRWGTYAHRLVRRKNAQGAYINPLKQTIKKLRSEACKPGPKKSCYELGVAEGEYDLPLYNTVTDGTRRRGGPCLSHLSFKLLSGAVHLTAFYRSHDYRYKVPGNLLGLARLQSCVARETDLSIGSLVIHSSYAYLNGSKGRIRTLLGKLHRTDRRKETHCVVADRLLQ